MRGDDLGPILFTVVGTDDYNILKYDDDDDSIDRQLTIQKVLYGLHQMVNKVVLS